MSAHRAGFSTIEALAAIAIVAVALVPLLSLQTQIARGYAQQRSLTAQSTAVHNGLAILRATNPMQTPEGSVAIGQAVLRWRSDALSPIRPAAHNPAFEVQMFVIHGEIIEGAQRYAFDVESIGWRAVSSDQAARPSVDR